VSLALAAPALAAGWTNVANLGRERAGHSAVTLPNGKVLVSGGCVGWKNLFTAECEIYDPAANTWTPTGAMSTPRSEHGLVVLQNGKVLAIGGFYQASDVEYYLETCEIYDPASGTWSATGPMAVDRTVFSSTLLQNGKVLVAGGLNKNPSGADVYLAGTEVYDPASGTWATAPDLAQSRTAHTATLLPNGKVLVVGGASGFTAIQAAEEYDPASNTWASAGSTASPHAGHTATLLQNGKVLIAAGAAGLSIGSAAELYDPVARTWSATGGLVKARALHIAVLLDSGKVLAAGGGSGFSGDVLKNPMADAELYDPASGSWTATDPMPFTRSTFPACKLNDGRVLVTGGLWYDLTNYYCRRKSDIYTPEPGQCTLTCTASAAPTSGTAPLTVNFTGTATATGCAGAVDWQWVFGDGEISSQQNPSHTYASPGTFDWVMTAAVDGQTCTQTGTITATPGGGGMPGDCDGNGSVSIGEVQKAINMFLGLQAIGCGVDCNGSGSVSIGEVQKVINCFLGIANSC
jgi:N-acetylneuraminic acid mutarotase